MGTDLIQGLNGTFSDVFGVLDSVGEDFALVTPEVYFGYQPNVTQGLTPPPMLFDHEGENTASLQSDITDHFVEDNTPLEDHIALRPPRVTVHGFKGELVFTPPNPTGLPGQIQSTLAIINDFVPGFSQTAQQVISGAAQAYNNAVTFTSSAVSVISSLATGQGNQTKQAAMFAQWMGYWRARLLWTVQTPFGVFKNMAVEEVTPTQDETTRMVTDFYVSFKQIRKATTKVTGPLSATAVGRAAEGNTVNLGLSTPAQSQDVLTAAGSAGLGG